MTFIIRRALFTAYLSTLLLGVVNVAQGRVTDSITVPEVMTVPVGDVLYKSGHAKGTQNYVSQLSATGAYSWAFFGPQATVLKRDSQIMPHFLSTNADTTSADVGSQRPSWQHSVDSSMVWGKAAFSATSAAFPDFVAVDAIPWLLVQVTGAQDGPRGGKGLTKTTYLQRVNTAGGLAPGVATCDATAVSKKALVPYETDSRFYTAQEDWVCPSTGAGNGVQMGFRPGTCFHGLLSVE